MNQEFVPRLVFWELTTGCNLRCVHCRATAQELASPYDLSTPDALKVIEQVSSVSHPILILSGGEPLFRKDLFQLAAYAVERGLLVALATNGTLITPAVAGEIRSAGVRRVAISFDGADAETHDRFRGIPGAFEAARRGLKNVQDAGLSTQINTTIARHNAHQLPQILEMALALGVDALHTFLLVPVGCGVNIADEQMVPAAEYEKILHWFYDREREGRLELSSRPPALPIISGFGSNAKSMSGARPKPRWTPPILAPLARTSSRAPLTLPVTRRWARSPKDASPAAGSASSPTAARFSPAATCLSKPATCAPRALPKSGRARASLPPCATRTT